MLWQGTDWSATFLKRSWSAPRAILNERIAELEQEGHRGHAMEGLKANAMDFASRIDELRSMLVVVPTKAEPRKPTSSKSWVADQRRHYVANWMRHDNSPVLKKGAEVAKKKTVVRRPWTKADLKLLKALARA
jgi:hypothetical protein